ncbi:MAG: cytochrome b/b6 domain-containing protein [Pseudomonadota bacterium]
MRYDRVTRWLHAAIAFGITAQLGLSLFMEAPDDRDSHPATGLPLQLFEAHELIGLSLLGLLVAHWLWTLSSHVQGGMRHLFPWFNRKSLATVMLDLRAILRFQLKDPARENALAGAIHGLGLLAATAMAATGTVIFFNLSESGHMTAPGGIFLELHSLFASLIWVYYIGHVMMAIAHSWLGHASIREIFSLLKK